MKIATRCVCCDGARLARSAAVLAPFVAWRVFGWEPAEIGPDWGLRDIRQGTAYNVCATLECADCGLLFLDMRFDEAELASLYAGYRGADYTTAREHFEPGYAARNRLYEAGSAYVPQVEQFLAPHLPARPRVLDYGGDTGLNTPFRGGATLHHIYEISGLPVVDGATAVTRAAALAGTYDLVVSMQVLEHVASPLGLLRDMAECMTRDTLIYLEVPREELIQNATPGVPNASRKRHWHEHINFFTEPSLDALLAGAGLAKVASLSLPVFVAGRNSVVQGVLARRR